MLIHSLPRQNMPNLAALERFAAVSSATTTSSSLPSSFPLLAQHVSADARMTSSLEGASLATDDSALLMPPPSRPAHRLLSAPPGGK